MPRVSSIECIILTRFYWIYYPGSSLLTALLASFFAVQPCFYSLILFLPLVLIFDIAISAAAAYLTEVIFCVRREVKACAYKSDFCHYRKPLAAPRDWQYQHPWRRSVVRCTSKTSFAAFLLGAFATIRMFARKQSPQVEESGKCYCWSRIPIDLAAR